MHNYELKTPIAFFIYNRITTAARVFEIIRQAKPSTLFVVADGPRSGSLDDADACRETRALLHTIDWKCDVFKNYAEQNLGCKDRISSGLSWVFNNVEEAIILEDDCLPHPTFFRFCDELLEKYRFDDRVMMISGCNFQQGLKPLQGSYYFSRYAHIWGWASWRRAWAHYDVHMHRWPDCKSKGILHNLLGNKKAVSYWERVFDRVYAGKINTWDFQWLFSCWVESGLTVLPAVNLISNIGFDRSATHTGGYRWYANLKTRIVDFPLVHPDKILCDRAADEFTERSMFFHPFLYGILFKLKSLFARATRWQ